MNRRQFLGSASTVSVALSLPPDILADDVPSDITEMSASMLSSAIRQRIVSCEEVMGTYLDRIERLNPTYNAVVSLRERDACIEDARTADKELAAGHYRGWLHGIPHAVKDLVQVKDLPTSYGSRLYAGEIAEEDELLSARLRSAGAIFIGKTNTPEWGLGSQTYNDVFGVTRNAYDSDLCAGGSSGGAAVGLATHMLPVADGSDMMGSLRNPAGYNNVIGFRPSQGRVPTIPSNDLYYQQLATDGPMGRNVEDTIRLLSTLAGYDPRSPLAMRDTLSGFDAYQPVSLRGYSVGWMGDYDGYLPTEPGVIELCEEALAGLAAHGALVANCMPDYDMARLWRTWLTLRHWSRSADKDIYDDPAKRALIKPEWVWEIEGSFDITGAELAEAGVARADWYRALLELFDTYDVLALPTAQVFPFDAALHWPKTIAGREMDTYHRWMEVVIGGTLAGLPVVAVPAGFDGEGRPMGLQFIGRAGEDQAVLEFALAYEAATDHLERPFSAAS